MAKSPASRNDPASPGTSGVVANRFPTVNVTHNDPVQSPYSPGSTPLPPGSPTPYGPAPAPKPAPAPTLPPPDTPAAPPLDWHAYLANWGFDQDIVNELDRIFRTYSDPSQAAASALAYIRGTDWYAKTFPGIQEGMKLGVVNDEASYRAYTNQLNDLYHRYYGRGVTGADVSSALGAGYTPGRINQHFAGQAYIAANRNDIQYTLGAFDEHGALSEDQLGQFGDQQGGLDNLMGPELQRRYQAALQRLHGAFQGTLASPNFALNRYGRPAAPSLGGGITPNDVAA